MNSYSCNWCGTKDNLIGGTRGYEHLCEGCVAAHDRQRERIIANQTTAEREHDRLALSGKLHGGCSCHLNPPCNYCVEGEER